MERSRLARLHRAAHRSLRVASGLLPVLLLPVLLGGCAALMPTRHSGEGGDPVTALKRGNDAYARGRLDAARSQYRTVLASVPDNALVLTRLGNIAYRFGNLADASDYYRRSLDVQREQPNVHFNLAMAELSLARQHLNAYLELSRSSDGAVHALLLAIDRFADRSDEATASDAEGSRDDVGAPRDRADSNQ